MLLLPLIYKHHFMSRVYICKKKICSLASPIPQHNRSISIAHRVSLNHFKCLFIFLYNCMKYRRVLIKINVYENNFRSKIIERISYSDNTEDYSSKYENDSQVRHSATSVPFTLLRFASNKKNCVV